MNFPLGKEQLLSQLDALGFTTGSRLYGRVLLPRELQESQELRTSTGCEFTTIDFFCDLSGDRLKLTRLKWVPSTGDDGKPELKPDGSQKFKLVPGKVYLDGYKQLQWWNRWGGIYFNPCQGGRFNRDITACPSAYFESDEGTFDEQWLVIDAFEQATGIGPTCVVRTRKSLHVYYRFPEDEWTVEGWTEDIQRPLALAMRSDPAIQNTGRLMRLAGFNHVKWVDEQLNYVPVTLDLCQPERQYTRVQFKEAIASVLPEPYSHKRFKFWVYLSSPAHKDLSIDLDPEIARSCTESDLDETSRRWRQFIRLTRNKANGKDVDPHSAFGCDLKKLPRTYHHKTVDGNATPFEGDHNTIIWARFLYGYDPNGRADYITAQDPLIPESERHLHSIDSLHIHKTSGALKSHRGGDAKDIYARMKEIAETGVYQELTQLTATPWKEVNTANLDLESLGLEPGAIYVVCSAKGTGKTNSLVPLIPKIKNVYAWFSRVALGREECNRLGIPWKDDLGKFNGSIKAGFCADSAYQFSPKHLMDNGLLLVDEADQVFEHMFGSTCNKDGKRPMILGAFKAQLDAVIAGNGIAICMSADITDKEFTYLSKIVPPGCPVRLIVNHYKPDLGDVYFHKSKTPDGVIEELLENLERGIPCFVIDDMRTGVRGCKSIAEYIRKLHPEWTSKIVEINSDTSGDPEIIYYLKTINTASLDTLLLCCSPSVISGISIENGQFEEVYGFYNGVLIVSQASQSLSRVRGAKSLNVWAAESGLIYAADRSLFPEQIKGYYKRNYEQNVKHILAFNVLYNPLKDEWDSPHFDLYCKYSAERNNCMVALRTRLEERLEQEGYCVISVDGAPSDMVKAGLEEAWTTVELNHARAVASANILNDAQLKSLENSTLTSDQKLDMEKTFLLKAFGQELIDAMVFEHASGEILRGFAAMVLKDTRGAYRQQLDAFYLLTTTPEVAIAKDAKAEQRQLDQGHGRFAGDIRWNARQRKAREFLGLPKFLDPSSWWGPSDFAALAEKAKKHAGKIKDAIGFAVQRMTNGQIFGELMAQMGLELNKEWAPGVTASGRRYKLRQITADSWKYAQIYVNYRESLLQQNPVSDPTIPDHPPVEYYSETAEGGDQGLSHTQQGLEVVSGSGFEAGDLNNKTDSRDSQASCDRSEVANLPIDPPPANVAQSSDHPPGDLLSEVLGGGYQGIAHIQQGIDPFSDPGFEAGDFNQQPHHKPTVPEAGVSINPAIIQPDITTVAARASAPAAYTELAETQELPWGVVRVLPGSVVECFGRVGQWVVKYCTGDVAKIFDWLGREEYASCETLRLWAGVTHED